MNRWQTGLADVGWNSLYLENHDQPRSVSRFGNDGRYRVRSAKLLATVLHLHRGTPYVYQGEELGMTNAPFTSVDDFRDVESLNYYREALAAGQSPEDTMRRLRTMSRDHARTPMQWDASEHAGFTTGTPWLPVNPNNVEINAAAELDDADSVFRYYQRLIALRHSELVVALGDFTMLLSDDEHVYAYTRRLGPVELLVLANFSESQQIAAIPDAQIWADAELVISNVPGSGDQTTPSILQPWEAAVYRRTIGGESR
jgi:oligo-1,6-glucosidase